MILRFIQGSLFVGFFYMLLVSCSTSNKFSEIANNEYRCKKCLLNIKLQLKEDSSFLYKDFRTQGYGKWRINGDKLILESRYKLDSIMIGVKYSDDSTLSMDSVRIICTTAKGKTSHPYKIIFNNDTNYSFNNFFSDTLIVHRKRSINKLQLFFYPLFPVSRTIVHAIKNDTSNVYTITADMPEYYVNFMELNTTCEIERKGVIVLRGEKLYK